MFLEKVVSNKINLVKNMTIYFLIKGNEVVYVGRTKRFYDRILSHTQGDKEFDSYYIIQIYDESLYVDLERYFIFKYKPRYNKKFPTEVWFNNYKPPIEYV